MILQYSPDETHELIRSANLRETSEDNFLTEEKIEYKGIHITEL